MKKFVAGGVVFVLLLMVNIAWAENKVAVVDATKIFDSYSKTQQYDKVLEEKGAKYQSELEAKLQEIKKAQDSLSLLSDAEKTKKQAEFEKQVQEVRNFNMKRREELQEEQNQKMKEVVMDIDKIIQDYAKKNGYSYIFDKRFMVYSDDSLDITSKIIEILKAKQ